MWSEKHMSPQTEENFDLFPPFARRSQEVNRYCEESVLPVQPQYDQPFWRIDVPLPGEELFRYEPSPDPGLHPTSPAEMVSRRKKASAGLTHEKLPHPSQLMGRKKSAEGLEKVARNVLQHMGDLRMRQRHINALKGDRWSGGKSVFSSEESRSPNEAGNEQLLGLTAGISYSTMLMDNPEVTMTKPCEAASSLSHQKFLFREYEHFLDLAPGGNPMMTFVAGTAHRSLLMAEDAVNPAGSGVFLRTEDDVMALLQNHEFF